MGLRCRKHDVKIFDARGCKACALEKELALTLAMEEHDKKQAAPTPKQSTGGMPDKNEVELAYDDAMEASNELGYACMTAGDVIRQQAAEILQLRNSTCIRKGGLGGGAYRTVDAEFDEWWSSTPTLDENKRTIAEKAWKAAQEYYSDGG